MTPRILLFGATSIVGFNLARIYPEAILPFVTPGNHPQTLCHWPVLKLADPAWATAVFAEHKPLGALGWRGLGFFAVSGFMNFLSYVFIYTALSMERVSLISPLVNASSLFVLPLSLIFLKDVEKLTARKIGATTLVIMGVLLISWEKL